MGNTTSISGNLSGNVSGNIGNITARSRSATATSHVANAAATPVRLFYKGEKMNLQDLIEGSQLKDGDSIVILPGHSMEAPISHNLYVTGFQVSSEHNHCCHGKAPMSGLNNLLVEAVKGHPKSYIITANNDVKLAKTGEIWVDVDGLDHTPKK